MELMAVPSTVWLPTIFQISKETHTSSEQHNWYFNTTLHTLSQLLPVYLKYS